MIKSSEVNNTVGQQNAKSNEKTSQSPQTNQISLPSISLPKGGGAIRGIGEKFSVNAATGTGSVNVPIYTSPGRSGFGPQLSLSYDSGAGNGPFGLGWYLSNPSISRRTDKGLPLYQDEEESDTFILSGAEDLVPMLIKENGKWVKQSILRGEYRVQRYRPRIEGLFARIERWTNIKNGEIHWRSISKDNVTTLYGKSENSRIADPDNKLRVFNWLICESFDDKGNAISYEYKKENSDEILTSSHIHEKNRIEISRSVQRYLKRIKYGNKTPRQPWEDLTLHNDNDWMFEVVFDYGEHYDEDDNGQPTFVSISDKEKKWKNRKDPFSTYRSTFEIRTYRLCKRVLMFHHFLKELGVQDYLVRSTEFTYDERSNLSVATFLTAVTQSGFVLKKEGVYFKKSLPPLDFEYSQFEYDENKMKREIHEIDAKNLENLPYGLDGSLYQWVDLDGEGLSGMLTDQADAWFYKHNESTLPVAGPEGKPITVARFAAQEVVNVIPTESDLANKRNQLIDLAGDGQLDLVKFEGSQGGYFERTVDDRWKSFVPFRYNPNIQWDDPNLRFVDLTGDGHADILITEQDVLTWYPSMAEEGFSQSKKVSQAIDEEKGPKVIFGDGTESIYLADMSGDGLSDLVRIRNGEVCYWPNLGYGKFGAKVTMDSSPIFDASNQFDNARIRLADSDGSGTTDIIYLAADGMRLYFNLSGNSWSDAIDITEFPIADNLSSVTALDLLGNGTACLLWSSPNPADGGYSMRYIDLMRGVKPHLLISVRNNLGAETRIHFSPSTKFYLADKYAGKPWVTKLPFPVQVVEHVETFDWISRNYFVARYIYHEGYFDGIEREFRGFGFVEQLDTEEFATLSNSEEFPVVAESSNIDESSHIAPTLTKTWFHTGVYIQGGGISRHFAEQYYREPGLTDEDFEESLLDDALLPSGLTAEEEREACRALKGSILRQEVYATDNSPKCEMPYTVSVRNYEMRLIQKQGINKHGIFLVHVNETIDYHYERNPEDPRIYHSQTLEVDSFGNILKVVNIGYGRRKPDANPLVLQVDRDKQTQRLMTYTENRVTNAVDSMDHYRAPLLCESCTYELTGYTPTGAMRRFQSTDFVKPDDDNADVLMHIFDEEISYEDQPTVGKQRRLIEQARTLYRKNDLTGLLSLGQLESLALSGESYKLAFTPGLLALVFRRAGQPLLLATDPNDHDNVLGGHGGDKGGYVSSQQLKAIGNFPDTDLDNYWWKPSGTVFYSYNSGDTAVQELDYALQHFFLPRRYRDPFYTDENSTETVATFDTYDLLMLETRDPVGNRVTVGQRLPNGQIDPNRPGNDYRVLQARVVTDPNRNRTEVAFDALGMVTATAVKGKDDSVGDTLTEFEPDLTKAQVDEFYSDPHDSASTFLTGATTRIIYDLHRFCLTQKAHPEDPMQWLPIYAAMLARETHLGDPVPADGLHIQIGFTYSDGFGREIQKKIQAEPGPLVEGDPKASLRWIGSSWTVYNNKGKPVRQYEPFFSQLPPEKRHHFEFGVQVGVSSVLFYDPVGRIIAILHPNHTYEKILFDSWKRVSYDVNDTIAAHGMQTGDPRTDLDINGHVSRYFATLGDDPSPWHNWLELRQSGAMGTEEQDAAYKATAHANTPANTYFDSLGRAFLTVLHNRFEHKNAITDETYATRIELDIEGNQLLVRDAIMQNGDAQGRIIVRFSYDMLGNRIHQLNMEAGAHWMLNDVAGKPIRSWDSRGHFFRTEYDTLRRLIRTFVTGADPTRPEQELLTERMVYGEQHTENEQRNLRGKFYLQFDQAGMTTIEDYDFKGNPIHASRRLAKEYKQAIDWGAIDDDELAVLEAAVEPILEIETFTGRTTYDALNRPIQIIFPHSSKIGTKLNVSQPAYNAANLLERIDVWLELNTVPTVPLDPNTATQHFVKNIEYNANGQRKVIEYGNGASTYYEYDPLTFRLIHLLTVRNNEAFPDDCPHPQPLDWPGCHVQNLQYTYDPVGNITNIRDDAQQIIFFRNKRVVPSSEYTYDATYRLIKATGREHLGQDHGPPIPHSYNDARRIGLLHPNDGTAMGTYAENYVYDGAGNLLEMNHTGDELSNPGWTRHYSYAETSLIEDGTNGTSLKFGNRLTSTTVGGNNPQLEEYSYDDHGNMIHMPQLQIMQYDYKDLLCMTQRQKVNNEDEDGIKKQGERTYYVYNAAGQRARKITVLPNDNLKDEHIYLGQSEVYRRHTGTNAGLVRETVHILGDNQRIALVESRNDIDDGTLKQLICYQFSNHLGSASLELSEEAQIISYEEYTPYGSTSYQAVRVQTETARRRYRYTAKERDEESGLYYHGARHYAPWLARWIATDPVGIKDGINVYAYVRNRPTAMTDPTGTTGMSEEPNRSTSVQDEEKASSELGKAIDEANDQNKRVLLALRQREVSREPLDEEKWTKDVVESLRQSESSQKKVDKAAAAAEKQRQSEYEEELRKEAELEKELPGTIGSLTPLYGSGKSSLVHFSHGNYGRGIAYGALAISDVFLVKSLFQGGAKLAWKLGGNIAEETVESGGGAVVRFSGQYTKEATQVEKEMFLESLSKEIELSRSEMFSGAVFTEEGKAFSVGVEVGPGVASTLHTHPQSGVALFSLGDANTFYRAGYSLRARHSVLGLKWPNAERVLALEGLDPVLDVVKTTVRQPRVTFRVWSKQSFTFNF